MVAPNTSPDRVRLICSFLAWRPRDPGRERITEPGPACRFLSVSEPLYRVSPGLVMDEHGVVWRCGDGFLMEEG
jgi:hypothetical protein